MQVRFIVQCLSICTLFKQLYSDNMEANTKMRNEAHGFDASTSTALASYGLDDDDRKYSEQLTCARETNEGPSFDLGF